MADDAQTIRSIHWRELFPFTHLFRAFRIAIHPSKLVLGFAMLFLLYGGGRALDYIWSARDYAVWNEIDGYQEFIWSHGRAAGFDSVANTGFLNDANGTAGKIAGGFEAVRDDARDRNAHAYANLLTQNHIVNDPAQALDDAYRGRHRGALQQIIVTRRNADLADAVKQRDDTLNRINQNKTLNQADRDRARRDAEAHYEASYRAAQAGAQARIEHLNLISPRPIFDAFFEYEIRQFHNVVDSAVTWNWLNGVLGASGPQPASIGGRHMEENGNTSVGVLHAVANMVTVGPGWLIANHWIYFVLYAIWFLLIWAIFGGAICRIAAVHAGRDEKISVRQALRFSTSKLLSFFCAPLIPLIIILILGFLMAVGGLLMYIPGGIGPILVGIFFFLPLLAGFIITLVATGTVGGFNLMYPTIAVEGSDSFDAISRSFSYIFARPWRMIFYTVLSIIYGALCFLFVRYFVYVMLGMTHFFVQWLLWSKPGRYWPEIWPTPSDQDLAYHINYQALAWTEQVSAFLIAFWVYIVLALLAAFVVSFYFSSNTLIYYLMRREVDATEMDDVYVEETDEEFGEPTPTSGTMATATTTTTTTIVAPASGAPATSAGDVGAVGTPVAPPTPIVPPAPEPGVGPSPG